MSFAPSTRRRFLIAGGLCLLVVAVLCVYGARSKQTLDDIDSVLRIGPSWWRADHPGLRGPLLLISKVFNTIPMATAAILAALLLAFRRHRRAAVFTAGVMTVTVALSGLLKGIVGRPRQIVEDPILVVDNPALPSGHSAYMAAAAGVALVLAALFVRKRSHRRFVLLVGIALAVLIGADRLMLGVHTPTDVVAGYALGAGVVLLAAYAFDPAPRLITAEPLPGPTSSTRKLACIVNPAKLEDVAAFRSLVAQLAADSGWSPPTWAETTVEDPGRAMAEEAAVNGADLVLVCGGDGTVRTVCGELAGTGIPVGVVPAGTGNLLARNLDLPLYLRSAVDVALNGQDRAIDLVRVTGDGIEPDQHFLVMAGMGFDAAIMEGANEQMKAKVGWLAYFVSGLRQLRFSPVRVEISVDDSEWTKHRARTIVIGNVGFLQAGLPLLPDAAIDDGTLDLVVIYPRRFLSWVSVVARVIARDSRSDETVTRMTGRSISIRASSDVPRQIDGDSIGAGREIHCECMHGRLLVRVPR